MRRIASGKVSVFASHGLVLLHVAQTPNATMREIAWTLGLTERRIGRILGDLENANMIRVAKQGNRNVYSVDEDAACPHPSLSGISLRDVVGAIKGLTPEQDRPAVGSLSGRILPGFFIPYILAESAGFLPVLI